MKQLIFSFGDGIDPAEMQLRALWTSNGVSVTKQNQLIEQITGKAAAGSWVGPFQIPERGQHAS